VEELNEIFDMTAGGTQGTPPMLNKLLLTSFRKGLARMQLTLPIIRKTVAWPSNFKMDRIK
jgi:hypothetical protein